jgi:acyl-CoA synthetase (AMP-forming)/AMP-acid ligase II
MPILTIDMDASGAVSLVGVTGHRPVPPPAMDDVALVLHTSGSTGRPKRVPLAHANLSFSACNVARCYALGADDVSMCVMALFQLHGLVASTLATLTSGGTVVVPATFGPLSFWRIARDHDVTWYSAVPALHQLLLARAADPSDPSRRPAGTERLRFIRSCGGSLPSRVMHALETAFGAPVLEAYGMTEAAHQMTSNPLPPAKRKPGSVGCGTGVRIGTISASGRHCPPGERGEVVIQGPNVIRGYEDTPEANASSFVDGWFRTGDRGDLDDEGYLWLVGSAEVEGDRFARAHAAIARLKLSRYGGASVSGARRLCPNGHAFLEREGFRACEKIAHHWRCHAAIVSVAVERRVRRARRKRASHCDRFHSNRRHSGVTSRGGPACAAGRRARPDRTDA